MTGLLQRLKPVVIQTFIPERANEAPDVSVMGRAASLPDQNMLVAVLPYPGQECPASEFWPVVSLDRFGVALKRGGPVHQAGHAMPTNAKVGREVHALVREVISYRQAFDRKELGSDAHSFHQTHSSPRCPKGSSQAAFNS